MFSVWCLEVLWLLVLVTVVFKCGLLFKFQRLLKVVVFLRVLLFLVQMIRDLFFCESDCIGGTLWFDVSSCIVFLHNDVCGYSCDWFNYFSASSHLLLAL